MPSFQYAIEQRKKAERAFNFFINKGYSPAQASGLVGNFIHESGLSTTIEGDKGIKGGASKGIGQWRQDRLKRLQNTYGDAWTDLDNQLEFVYTELNTTHKKANEKLLAATTAYDAGSVVSDFYEIPAVKYKDNKDRQKRVEDVFTAFTNLPDSPQETNIALYSAPDFKEEVPEDKNAEQAQQVVDQRENEDRFLQEYINSQNQPLQQEQYQPMQQQQVLPFGQNILAKYAQIEAVLPQIQMQEGGKVYNPVLKNDSGFQKWYLKNTIEGRNNVPYSDQLDYDYLSYYMNGDYKNYKGGHFPDTYKRPNHKTFSVESLYSTPENPGGRWKGEKFILKMQDGGQVLNYKNPYSEGRMYLDENSELYKYWVERDKYFNPPKKDVSSGNEKVDFLYNNDWLFSIPGVNTLIKNKAKEVAKSSSGEAYIEKENFDRKGNYEYTGENFEGFEGEFTGIKRKSLVDQYFSKDAILPRSQYKPKSDYLQFLPSYSIKGNFDKMYSDPKIKAKFKEIVSNEFFDGKYKDFVKNKKTVYKTKDETSDFIQLLNIDLAGHKLGAAWDEKVNLPYVSVADAWDFEPESYTKNYKKGKNEAYVQSYLMHKAGHPFKVYDRFYFNPETMEYINDAQIQQLLKKNGEVRK